MSEIHVASSTESLSASFPKSKVYDVVLQCGICHRDGRKLSGLEESFDCGSALPRTLAKHLPPNMKLFMDMFRFSTVTIQFVGFAKHVTGLNCLKRFSFVPLNDVFYNIRLADLF